MKLWAVGPFSFAVVFLSVPPMARGDDIYYTVTKDHALCLLQNAESYLNKLGEPLLIVIDLCPEITDPVLAITTNEAPDLPPTNDNRLDRLLSFTKAQLRCLSAVTLPAGDGPLRIFPESCRMETDS